MNKVGRIQKVIVLSGMVMVEVVASVFGQTEDSLANRLPRRFVHGLGVEARPEYVFPTHPFLRGENPERKLIRGAFSTHFKYALHYQPGSIYDRIYGNVYQGIGLGCYSFGESRQIGNPVAFYLFQEEQSISQVLYFSAVGTFSQSKTYFVSHFDPFFKWKYKFPQCRGEYPWGKTRCRI